MAGLLERRMIEAVVKPDHGRLAGLEDDDHGQYLLADGTRGLSADWDAGDHEVRARSLQADVATGTAPLTIASTTLVSNLNADKLDGNDAAAFAASSHASDHENGGGDEISVAGLSGELADGQPPKAHKDSHDPGGSDGLDVATPTDIGTANAPGSAASFVRSDHVHAIPDKWRTRTFNIEIPLPDAADGFLVHWFPKGSTLVSIHTDTEAATSVTFNMYERPISSSWSGGVKVDVSDHVATTGFLDMDLDNNTGMAVDSCLIFVASAVSGSPGVMRVWGEYTID